jgi:signal transduction histidine kinase
MLARIFKDIPIERKLRLVILLTSGAVLFLTCSAFFVYEFVTFRQTIERQISTLGKIIATNSTAALAFESSDDANEILAALKAEQNIVAACLYDKQGKVFSVYPTTTDKKIFPEKPDTLEGYKFNSMFLEGFQPVIQGDRHLGTLYLKSDLETMYDRFKLYSIIAVLVVILSSLLAYLLSRFLQRGISKPILALAETAKAISEHHDYTVRATKLGKDELGSLTDAFNLMLMQIQEQNQVLSEFNQKLEQKVMERTSELEAANKELGAFSYSVSHDLRAPLRAIHGYMNIFAEDYTQQLDDEAKKLIQNVLNNAKRMGQLIDDLLEFSRLGRKELIKNNVSMKAIVSSVWEELRKMEGNRNIEFILKELPEAKADNATIRHVWSNLISNALKYSGNKEKVIIEIGFEENEDVIIYYIKDNGVGFDMNYYNKLFGVFQRLHSQEEFEGTGVGLAIVQRIILKHGGLIWAESKLNEGATFYFSLKKN